MKRRFRPLVYVRFRPDWLCVRWVGSGIEYADNPAVAIDATDHRFLGVGREALSFRQSDIVVASGFAHDRTIIADVYLAMIALKHALRQVLPQHGWRWAFRLGLRPDLILQPLQLPGDELVPLERYALEAIGRQIGGRIVSVWIGRELADAEILAGEMTRLLGWVPRELGRGHAHGA